MIMKTAPRVSFAVNDKKSCEKCRYYKALNKSCRIYLKPIEKSREPGLCGPQARMFVPSHVVLDNMVFDSTFPDISSFFLDDAD
jgi:hypothetical protein